MKSLSLCLLLGLISNTSIAQTCPFKIFNDTGCSYDVYIKYYYNNNLYGSDYNVPPSVSYYEPWSVTIPNCDMIDYVLVYDSGGGSQNAFVGSSYNNYDYVGSCFYGIHNVSMVYSWYIEIFP